MDDREPEVPLDIIDAERIGRLYEAGFMVVPIRPTERMVRAGADASRSGGRLIGAEVKWSAMLAAAPRASAGGRGR